MTVAFWAFVWGCGSGEGGGGAVPIDTGPDVAPDPGPAVEDPVSCDNACKRVPKCAPELSAEADCLANCAKAADPHAYACCVQYADGCAKVQACIQGGAPTCDATGEPWVPIPIFGECPCGDPKAPTPFDKECKATGTDTQCATEACLKLVNSHDPPFCAIECTQKPTVCPPGTKCTETPRSWYCREL